MNVNDKTCTKCKILKPITQYNRHTKSTLRSDCKDCTSKHMKNWSDNNYEKVRNNRLIYTYGITYNDYLKMLEKQNGVCAICKKSEISKKVKTNTTRSLCVDHCHITGVVRALLCRNCNTAIGYFQESLDTLQSAISYLETFKTIL